MIEGVEAMMTGEELRGWREMSGLGKRKFCERLGITTQQLDTYEADEEEIPARFDDDVERLVDAALYEMDDPGPGRIEVDD